MSHVLPASQFTGRQERLVHDAFPVALLRPEFFAPGFFAQSAFLLSLYFLGVWGLNPVSCACQSCAVPLSYTRSQSSTLLCDVCIFVFLGRFSRSLG